MGRDTTGAIMVCQVGYVAGINVEAPVYVKGPRDGTPSPESFPNNPYSFNNFPPYPGNLQGPNFILVFLYSLIAIFFNTY